MPYLHYPTRKRDIRKWLILLHYPNGKHHIFITEETERQLHKRIKAICYDARDKIAYMTVYLFYKNNNNDFALYDEYKYRNTSGNYKPHYIGD